jgi:hypothetical protein
MSARYEYNVVSFPETPHKTRESDATKLINEVAEQGWRLVSVTSQPGQNGRKTYGYFERPIPSEV